jgi:SM-20-related protein
VNSQYEELIQGLLDKGFGSVDNWLEKEELDCLRKSVLDRYQGGLFHQAGIGAKENFQKAEEIRKDQVFWLDKPEMGSCEHDFFLKMDDFIQYLNRTCYAGIKNYEFHYAVYEEGSFYKKHIDQFVNDPGRKFSFVTYLSESWEPGDGGELMLYTEKEILTIAPTPGKILFFKSDLPHEVLRTNKTRLSLTGWLKV